MDSICRDLLDEYEELAAVAATLTEDQWRQKGPFYGWSAWDEVAHLCFFDEESLTAIDDGEAFGRDAKALMARIGRGEEISAIARAKYAHFKGPDLLAHWRGCYRALVTKLGALNPKARLPWYGPTMSALGFATARLMETWAHGQDVWDIVRRRRPGSRRLKHVAHLGVITLGWTYANRGLAVPTIAPFVKLTGPEGDVWTWGEATSGDFVRGSAEDFCLVVTQRRHVDDTGLTYSPGPVRDWLVIAQCFAGPVSNGPAPGQRRIAY